MVCVLGNLLFLDTYASEKQFMWSLQSGYSHDSNTRLSTTDEQSLSGYNIKPEAEYRFNDGINQYSSELSMNAESYNQSEYNFEGYSTKLDYRRNLERSSFLIDFGSDRSSTRTTEENDTGNITREASYKITTGNNLSWQYLIDPSSSLVIGTNAQKVKYESESFSDYTNLGLNVTWQKSTTQKTTWLTQIYHSVYESDSPLVIGNSTGELATESITNGLRIGLEHQFSPVFSFDFLIGNAKTRTRQVLDLTDQSSRNSSRLLVLDTSFDYRLSIGKLSFSASRDIQASGNGSLIEADNATINFNHNLSDMSKVFYELHYLQQRNDSNSINSDDDREFYRFGINYQRRLKNHLSITIGTSYRRQKLLENSDNDKAESVSGNISFRYQPQKIIW